MANTITEAIREGEAERKFWNSRWTEFKRDYPDQFVAVKDGIVVATDEDLVGLESKLHQLDLLLGKDVVSEFIVATPRNLLL